MRADHPISVVEPGETSNSRTCCRRSTRCRHRERPTRRGAARRGCRCIRRHGVDRVMGQQRTRGVDDVDRRDLVLLAADRDAPVVQDLERVAIESLERERPVWGEAVGQIGWLAGG